MEDKQEGKEGNLMNGRKRQFDERLVCNLVKDRDGNLMKD
jgi:hypothetical protein